MSVDEAKNINPNLNIAVWASSHLGNWPVYIMQSIYNSEIVSTIPNPLIDYTDIRPRNRRNYILYRSSKSGHPFESDTYFNFKDSEYTLLFFDNKLVGIETYFNITNSLVSELNQLYGSGFIVQLTSNDNAMVWHNQTRGRYVIWFLESRFKQVVTYIDNQWIQNLCKITLDEFRNSTSNQRNRLDW